MLKSFADELSTLSTIESVLPVERGVEVFDFLELVELLSGEFR